MNQKELIFGTSDNLSFQTLDYVLKKKLTKFFFLFKTEQLFAVQLSGNSIFSKNFDEVYQVIQKLIKEKKIEKIYLENYWEY